MSQHKSEMRFYSFYRFLLLFLVSIGSLMPYPALAYHFFQISSGGTLHTVKWRTLPVVYIVDNGPTDILSEIQDAFNTWNDVYIGQDLFDTPTRATVDFTGANFMTDWGNLTGDGQQEVIFDEDGTALARLGRDPARTNGLGPSRKEMVGGQGAITDAFLIINGTLTTFDRRSTEVHELGHNLGLAHSSVGMHNSASPPSDALDRVNINSVPTMHPFSFGTGSARRTLEADDIAGILELYPDVLSGPAGSIEGSVKRCFTNDPVLGANVRAVNISNPNIQITRYSGYDGNTAGQFLISVLPGDYRLVVEPMGANDFDARRVMAINTRVDADFSTEYYNPPEENDCTEEIPDSPVLVHVPPSSAITNIDFKVGGATLAFVVDDTGSMSEEIAGVRQVLSNSISITQRLLNTLRIPFPDTAIITFKDNVTTRLISNDPDRLQAVVLNLVASGGGDCPESSNAALLTAGRLLRKRGVAMLFTDADSRPNGPSRIAVGQLYRSKSLRLNVLLSDSCRGIRSAMPLVSPLGKRGYMDHAGSENIFDEFPPEPTLGFKDAVTTFSEISVETGGFFAAIPEINFGETERFINTGTNVAVSSVAPTVGLVTPGDGPQGSTLNVEITGANTNFQSSSVVNFSGGGITVNLQAINSPTRITANISIDPGALLEFRDVTVTTVLGNESVETATGTGAFQVVSPPVVPTIIGVSPWQGTQGETLDVSISGANTNFVDGTSVANFGTGITVNSTSVSSPTSAAANILIDESAAIGFRDVVVTTGTETAKEGVIGPFLVTAPPPPIPRLTSVDPSKGSQGQTLDVTITGVNTNFVDGTSIASFSESGITVNNTTITSQTSARANISIAGDATPDFRDVFVTTGDEVAAILNTFQVTTVTCQCPENGLHGCISGIVTKIGTVEPVAGKLVWLRPSSKKSGKKFVKKAVTDENGCYIFDNLPSRRYDVFATGGCKADGGRGSRQSVNIIRNGKVNDVNFECK